MLRGEHGRQREEVERLAEWLAADVKPEIVTLSNVLLSGIAPALKHRLNVPILAYLQGDDIFLDALRPEHREQAIELIRVTPDTSTATSPPAATTPTIMAGYLGLPRTAIEVILPGINLAGHGGPREQRTEPPFTVGYFARIAPAKGLHVLADAYMRLRQMPGVPPTRLRASGWLGAEHKPYLDGVRRTLAAAGLAGEFEYVDSPDHASKVRFLQSLDVMSVPTPYREPKGLYVLEALANGVPVVQPSHGSFPELIGASGGGLLVTPDDPPPWRRPGSAISRPGAAGGSGAEGAGSSSRAILRRGGSAADGRDVATVRVVVFTFRRGPTPLRKASASRLTAESARPAGPPNLPRRYGPFSFTRRPSFFKLFSLPSLVARGLGRMVVRRRPAVSVIVRTQQGGTDGTEPLRGGPGSMPPADPPGGSHPPRVGRLRQPRRRHPRESSTIRRPTP